MSDTETISPKFDDDEKNFPQSDNPTLDDEIHRCFTMQLYHKAGVQIHVLRQHNQESMEIWVFVANRYMEWSGEAVLARGVPYITSLAYLVAPEHTDAHKYLHFFRVRVK